MPIRDKQQKNWPTLAKKNSLLHVLHLNLHRHMVLH